MDLKVLIVEDEPMAYKRMLKLVSEQLPQARIDGPIDNCTDLKQALLQNWDLILCDIELSDGNCLQTLIDAQTSSPIIFTTAYSNFAIKAFEVNSIHYLLKPIEPQKLALALKKLDFKSISAIHLQNLLQQIKPKNYLQGSLFKIGQKMIPVAINQIWYFISEQSQTYAYLQNNKRYMHHLSIENLEKQLDPQQFCKLNRKCIVQKAAINTLKLQANGKLTVILHNQTEQTVSRDRANEIKNWLQQ